MLLVALRGGQASGIQMQITSQITSRNTLNCRLIPLPCCLLALNISDDQAETCMHRQPSGRDTWTPLRPLRSASLAPRRLLITLPFPSLLSQPFSASSFQPSTPDPILLLAPQAPEYEHLAIINAAFLNLTGTATLFLILLKCLSRPKGFPPRHPLDASDNAVPSSGLRPRHCHDLRTPTHKR